jgi:murein DD-endopeptidase MepM/ murein hydrolase activator NlpD
MAKERYNYNKRTLKYEKVRASTREKVLKTLSFLLTTLVFAVILFIAFHFFLDSPKEKMLKREVNQYEMQFRHLNEKLNQIETVLADLSDRDDNIYRVIFEAEPIPSNVRKAGYGGVNRYSRLEGYTNSDILIEATRRTDRIISQLYVQSKSLDEVYEMARNKTNMLASIPAIQPLSNKNLKRLSSFFGYRPDPIYKVKKFHEGVDFSAPRGTEIYATGDGVVTQVKRSNRHYGNTIKIDHGYGYQTVYAHVYEFKVKKGARVKRGQVIATVGNTGKSTAPHLHYEVRKDGKAVNPIHYFFNDLTPAQYEEVILLSQRPTPSMD